MSLAVLRVQLLRLHLLPQHCCMFELRVLCHAAGAQPKVDQLALLRSTACGIAVNDCAYCTGVEEALLLHKRTFVLALVKE